MFRGFLTDVSNTPDNATGFRENIDINDVYAETHLTLAGASHVQLVAGGDLLVRQRRGARRDVPLHRAAERRRRGECRRADDSRPRCREPAHVLGRLRARRMDAGAAGAPVGGSPVERHVGAPRREGETTTHTRPSGALGAIVELWERGTDHVKVFANYREYLQAGGVRLLAGRERRRARAGNRAEL